MDKSENAALQILQDTPIATLVALAVSDKEYPGIGLFVRTKLPGEGSATIPIGLFEYDQLNNHLRLVVYASNDMDEPTHVIPLDI